MDKLLPRIKEKGYWRILMRPNIFEKEKLPLNELHKIIEKTQVNYKLRSYPSLHYSIRPTFKHDYIELKYDESREYYRFYQSGQFISFIPMFEDHFPYLANFREKMNSKFLDIPLTVFLITEAYIFASRLAEEQVLGAEFGISITLYDIMGRQLLDISDYNRFSWYKFLAEISEYEIKGNYKSDEFILRPNELALEKSIELFYRFQWIDCPINILREEQRKLLE